MPRRGPDPDRVRELMAREAEVVEATESAGGEPAAAEAETEPDALPEQLESEHEPGDSDDPSVGPVHES